ncbi:hypothetical protein [Empedobacter sp. 189-2]|uniref:hypothetical protein n=1 Tax=Empedobacter sp. 189-2 TaxID=2746724 RepID=UPI002574EFDD|nr:hypothetical protein [Empedobacter sp. 189-2]MDM1542367.1 hypothetical protein [Empedobacter sp. 189-2]
MSNKIHKKLIIGEIEEITEIQSTDKVLISAENGEIKEVDKSKVGMSEDNVTDLISTSTEFVKNGEGWSLKYRVDNPSFYGTIGKRAIDLSVATAVNSVMPERFSFGGNAWYTAVFGNNNSAMGTASLVSGGLNRSQGQCNNIISYSSTIIEDKGTENISKKNNGIYSGTHNTITNARESVILGGTLNKITGDEKPKSGNYSASNAIIGGWNNEIFSSPNTNRPVYSSFILGGELNKAQGYYNIVGGYSNHAVTAGETLFGLYGTIQNTSLNGFDFINNSRMFNVGIGKVLNGNEVRIDGFSVYRHGLVTAPSLTTSLINSNNRALTTNEWVKDQIANFKLPTNWESPQQRFSGLEDKSADATYNKVMVLDADGKAGTKDAGDLGKVKTVNGQEPNENGDIEIEDSEFVKNGEGWSLKYAIDNPTKYEPTGLNAINLSKAYSDSTTMLGASGKDSTAIGAYTLAKGANSTAIGWNSKSYGTQSLTIGYSNISYSGFSTVVGGQANIIGVESEILTPISGQNSRASIFGGQNNKIINGRYATIIGGHSNTITATSKYNITSNPLAQNSILGGNYNAITDAQNSIILGGNSNSIIGHKVERNWAVTVAGGENVGKGSYSAVFGYRNKSITQGETLVGILSKTQDEALLPNTYYPSSRMFGVGVGNLVNDVTEVRKDGFNVYQNGLVTAPSLTNELIDSETTGKVLITKEYLNPATLIKILTSATTEQINQIKTLLGI